MTTSMLDAQWITDPAQPGRIAAGEAINIDVTANYSRVPGDDDGPDRLSTALRLVKETEALVLAAPAMAKALTALRERLTEAGRALPTARTAEELASMDTSITIPAPVLKVALEALAKALP